MKNGNSFVLIFSLIIGASLFVFPQTENIPANHPIYHFLKRMEVKNIISRYHDAVLPLSRKEIAQFIIQIENNKDKLTETETDILADYMVEFEYDLHKSTGTSFSLFGKGDDIVSGMVRGTFHDQEKYIYTYSDSIFSVFVDGLMNIDFRRSTGDGLHANASFVEVGPRLRGTIYDKLGYYFQLTNAQFWGSRDALKRDKRISQSYALGTTDSKNFDFVEGYVRYDADIISAQIGRERVLWGNSYGVKIFLSDYPRVYDAVRVDVDYKNFKYTFLHAWILGKPDSIEINNGEGIEPLAADKYFAAHRLEYSLGNILDLGIQEITIYSNRSVDLGYLNPVTFFESVQRSRGERDNGFLAFDFQLRPIKGYELQGTLFFDDINIPKWGTRNVSNRQAYQIGIMAVEPIGIPNTSMMVEYTRVEPFTFSHNRSRENQYSSNNVLLGNQLGPNADSWFFRINHYLTHRLSLSGSLEYQRSGENIYDDQGNLIKNVGGDFLVGYRSIDPRENEFLSGILFKTWVGKFYATYEIINEIYLDFRYEWKQISDQSNEEKIESHDYGLSLRIDF